MSKSKPVTIHLAPADLRLAKRHVASGAGTSVEDVIRKGLRLLAEREQDLAAARTALRKSLNRAIDQADAGDLVDAGSAVESIRYGIRRRAKRAG